VKQVREAALLGLLVARDPELKEFFYRQIEDRNAERRIRGLSVLALGFLKDSEYLRVLLDKKQKKLKGSKADLREIRACATLALGFTNSTDVAIPLANAAMDKYEEEEVRGYAPCSLGRLKAEMAMPELLRLIKRPDEERTARYGAAISMGWLVKSDNEAVIDVLGKKATRDRQAGVRTLLAIALGRIGGDRAASYLVSGLKGMDQRERGFYYLGLGISRSEDAGDILLRQFPKLKNNLDRAVCALALGLANHRAASPVLMEELEKGNPAFVAHGMVALGLLNEKKAIPLVREQLKEKDPVIIREGALALALLQGHAAMPKLIEMLKESKTTLVRGSIAFSLGYVGTEKALEPLLEIYRDKSRPGEQRAIALAALGRIGDPERIPVLSHLAYALNPFVGVDAVAEALTIL
jgi:HEAT repeat protein